MRVIVRSIDLTNFKGFAKLQKGFNEFRETIKAENGQGKTTLRDAFFWTLGFNHVGNVIPSKDNKEIPQLEIKSTMSLVINDIEYILERTQREVWKTNKDTGVDEKMNNESSYSIDGIEYTYKNYKEKIGELFGVDYEKLLMLTEKEFFNSNSTKWGWQNRRKELFELCEVDNLLKTLTEREEFNLIQEDIKKGHSTADIKKSIAKEIKGYKEEKERNMVLISDKQNDLAKYNSVDYDALEKERNELETKLTDVSLLSSKHSTSNELEELQQRKMEKELELRKLKLADANTTSTMEEKCGAVARELRQIKSRAEEIKESVSAEKNKKNAYLVKIEELKTKEWNGSTTCPTCGQALPQELIETSKAKFDKANQDTIEQYKKAVANIDNYVVDSEKQLNQMRENYAVLQEQYESYTAESKAFAPNPQILELEKEILGIIAKQDEIINNIDSNPYESQIAELRNEIRVKNEQLSFKAVINSITQKIEDLKSQNRDLTDKEMLCKTKAKQLDNYVQAQVEMVTELVNSKFGNGVHFSLFNVLYANSEHEISEECVCVLNGKTYDEMSYGEKFIADLEVAKTLQREYKVNLPLFLDNAECVTRDYIADQQLIELFASRDSFIPGIKIETIL